MLRSDEDIEGLAVQATDGPIGHVKDFYFDDQVWVVRYVVVEAGGWVASRKVLVSPIAIGQPDWTARVLPVLITKEQLKSSPDIDTERTVSRQYEIQYSGYPHYCGAGIYPTLMLPSYSVFGSALGMHSQQESSYPHAVSAQHQSGDPHLRSCAEIMKYHVHASDGDLGHVAGLLVDDETWAIRYLIVETGSWWQGHQVLIAQRWIQGVRWYDSKVSVGMTQETVQNAPAYDPAFPMNRAQETSLHRHYGRTGYWADDARRETGISRI